MGFGERFLGAVLGISAEQRGIIVHRAYLLNNADHKTEQ
jgi:hypothetical protein